MDDYGHVYANYREVQRYDFGKDVYKRQGPITEYDEALVRRLIEKVTVHDNHFTVEFKSGLETDVAM